ncbi:MAG: SUMF1/EgtB/PvdO family nonheme iron enzyme [Gammaproteobacteria bacterium]|nr:SUMF1/EgtB/PvdO family nonheme iron enzyme [Gammaproteobacteria bacterium]
MIDKKNKQKACCIPEPRAQELANRPKYIEAGVRPLNLVKIDAGEFTMGADHAPHPEDGETPSRKVSLDAFSISPYSITNQQFKEFVECSGYQSDAHRQGGSYVFDPQNRAVGYRLPHAPWWCLIQGAHWNNPLGDGASAPPNHPVVHVSHHDALAYCHWSGTRLPTEAQWELAARGGLHGKPFPWGEELTENGEHRCNVWQGEFPFHNSMEDGFSGTAPVDSYKPNGYGIYNMVGNIWEWCADRFSRLHSPKPVTNPKGPLSGKRFVLKGGSFLCHASYCERYRTSSRTANIATATAMNIGFRVVR